MSASTSVGPRHPLGLAWRLFAATGLVVIAGAGTMLVVASFVTQPVFRSHLDKVVPPVSAQARRHVNEAFASALLIALSVGVVVALVAVLVVSCAGSTCLRSAWRTPRCDALK